MTPGATSGRPPAVTQRCHLWLTGGVFRGRRARAPAEASEERQERSPNPQPRAWRAEGTG